MTFDLTITLGSLISLVGCVLTILVGLWRFAVRIEKLTEDVEDLAAKQGQFELALQRHSTQLSDLKVLAQRLSDGNERMNRLENRLERLEGGK